MKLAPAHKGEHAIRGSGTRGLGRDSAKGAVMISGSYEGGRELSASEFLDRKSSLRGSSEDEADNGQLPTPSRRGRLRATSSG